VNLNGMQRNIQVTKITQKRIKKLNSFKGLTDK